MHYFNILVLIIGSRVAAIAREDGTKFVIFYGKSLASKRTYELSEASEILSHPKFDASRETVLYIPDYAESPTSPNLPNVKCIENRMSNMLVLDWSALANRSYGTAVENSIQFGLKIAKILNDLFTKGMNHNLMHIGGHRLGGQLAENIRASVKKLTHNLIILRRISDLDSAPFYAATNETGFTRNIKILTSIIGRRATDAHYAKLHYSHQEKKCLILERFTLRKFRGFEISDPNELKIIMKDAVSTPTDMFLKIPTDSRIIEIFAKKLNALDNYIDNLCNTKEDVPRHYIRKPRSTKCPEIKKIVNGGHPTNRIDVVFMGDGYTTHERNKFFDDIRRLTEDMFTGVTFRSFLPLFNIWAVYVESVDSGIGYNATKDTPFGLYRYKGQLRAILVGNKEYARYICRLLGPGGCDYPSIIANDNYYGGLGGEFVISTRSHRTGKVVLRHEMGHNFIKVGEEYDNGKYYFGVNSAATLSLLKFKWGHWLTDETVREERVMYRLLKYPWADLSNGEQCFTFTSDGQYSRWYLLLSVSAAGEADCLEFILDDQILPWTTKGSDDREFYNWHGNEGFSPGEHTFSVRSKTPSTNPDIPRMICSVSLHEFGDYDEYHFKNDYVSAYPTWDVDRKVTFRPTNAGCLMRNMTHDEFCPVCKEGMWYQFMQRVSLIDDIAVSKVTNPNGTKRVILTTLKLGQLRPCPVKNERLEIKWFHGDQERPEFNNKFKINAEIGTWYVSVLFVTPEVRNDPNGLLEETERFTVTR